MRLPSRKFFLIVIISFLVVTALLGIIAVLSSGLGELGTKVLYTTIEVDIAAILGLCCAAISRTKLQQVVQLVGFVSIIVALGVGLNLLWVNYDQPAYIIERVGGVALIVSVASAHASLIQPLLGHNRSLSLVTLLNTLCIAIIAELLANYLIFTDFSPDTWYNKLIAVVLILDVLGTLLAIILWRLAKSSKTNIQAMAQQPVMVSPFQQDSQKES
jgi:hypothetical protein